MSGSARPRGDPLEHARLHLEGRAVAHEAGPLVLALLALGALCACASPAPPPGDAAHAIRAVVPPGPDTDLTMDVTATRLEPGRWQVEYAWPLDAVRLRFRRERWAFRAEGWEAVTPGVRLVADGGVEYVESVDGRPLRAVAFRFASDPRKRERDYPLNPRLTDGSEALFTGHLYLDPLAGDTVARMVQAVRLVSAAGEPVVVRGESHDGTALLVDDAGAGTFAYFGAVPARETEHVIAVVDPGLPAALRALFATRLPQLFDYYRARLGHALERKPLVLIAFDPLGEGLYYSGDVLPGVVRFELRGAAWSRAAEAAQAAEATRSAFYLVAHEAAHLWNGDLFNSAQNADAPWLHEGGAEAFAWLAMREFDVYDDDALRAAVEAALNRCLLAARGQPLQRAMGSSRTPYDCGGLINLMVGAELAGAGGLFGFWRALFDAAQATGARYDVEQYFATLERMAGDARLAEFLRAWLGMQPAGDADTRGAAERIARLGFDGALAEQLTRLGFDVASERDVPPHSASDLARELLAALMGQDCGGRFSVSGEPDGLRLGALSGCATLPPDGAKVTGFEGVDLTANPAAAYTAAYARCERGEPVRVDADSRAEPLALACPASLPRSYRVAGLPPRF